MTNPQIIDYISCHGKIELTIEQPDPAFPPAIIPYSGFVAGRHQIIFRKFLSIPQWKILTELGFSLFVCELSIPILPDEPRWFRWQISPYRIALTKRNWITWLKDWLLNRLISHYQILGPENVKYQLGMALQSYIEECLSKNLSDEDIRLAEAQEIFMNLGDEFRGSEVDIQDWRVHLFPGVFKNLERVNYDGDLKVSGTLPNHIVDPLGRFLPEFCYQWKAGERYIPINKQRNQGFFSMNFSATTISKIVLFLPWISLIIGVLALILSLITYLCPAY